MRKIMADYEIIKLFATKVAKKLQILIIICIFAGCKFPMDN